jgi:regulator of RNase E activity RraA
MAIGFAIHKAKRKVSSNLVERFRSLPVANISDVMSRIAGTNRLRPMHGGGWLGGPALTVKTRPGDNLMVHKAIDIAQPGDVIVVDAGGVLINAIIGEIMSTLAEKKGVAGFVIDGSIRDAGAIRAGSFPVFAAGVAHRGPYKDGPGEINCPVSIDGMLVEPGDLIVADDDGVLCVPYEDAAEICKLTEAKKASEEKSIQQILAGTPDRRWVDETLQRLGCEYKD